VEGTSPVEPSALVVVVVVLSVAMVVDSEEGGIEDVVVSVLVSAGAVIPNGKEEELFLDFFSFAATLVARLDLALRMS